jgi:hypothetical protein
MFLLLAATLALSACAWLTDGGTANSPQPLSMFEDVPLPPELTLNEKDSLVYEHEFGRVGLMKASGRLGRDSVLNYYRAAMAQNGWIKESEFDNGVSQMLIFSKAPRSAAITVTEGWLSTDVEINVSAKIQ